MRDRTSAPASAWWWPVVFVSALHLLSTAGTWWITDHGEILAVADRFLSTGRLDLRDLGAGWENWTRIATTRGSTATRFMPLSILALTPFLALDRLVGFHDPATFRIVHLQGHAFVSGGLLLVARFLTRSGANRRTSALAVLLLGLNWPVWMVARRIGPEPVLFFLMALLATGGKRSRLAALFLLPWVHASGGLLAGAGVLWLLAETPKGSEPGRHGAAGAWLAGLLSVGLLWSLPVHGHVIVGGYAAYASDPFFHLQNPVTGSIRFLAPVIAWTLPLWILASREPRRCMPATLALWLPLVVFFGTFSSPEPERRLMPLLAAWIVTVATAGIEIGRKAASALAVASLASGVLGLSLDFVDTVATPLGTFSGPILMLLRLAFAEGHPWAATLICAGLILTAIAAGSRTIEQLLDSAPSSPRLTLA